MLLQKNTKIEDFLVNLLSLKANLSVNDILLEINKVGLDFSQRGVYKELKKLEKDGIILKTKKFYNLDLSWIIESAAFIERAYTTYSNPNYLKKTLSLTEKKVIHNFSDLLRMDHYWVQILIAMHKMMPDERLYLWCPYQWFNLIHNYNISNFYSASQRIGAPRYHIMGGDNFLNRRALESLPQNGRYSFDKNTFSKEMGVYYSLIGDYILKVNIDSETTQKISEAFLNIKSEKDLKNYNLNQIFSRKVKAKIVVEKNVSKAKSLRNKFSVHFGE